MSNKLIFRILGALSSAIIIVSLFVPFSVLQTEGLWDIYSNQGISYISIVLLSFAIFSVVSFSLNIKTEFSYISFGACLFYIILKIIRMNADDSFSSISLGFYLFALGTIFTGVMAFLCNFGKNKVQTSNVDVKNEMNTNELSLTESNNNSTNLFNPELNLQPNTSIEALNTVNSSTLPSSTGIFDSPVQNEQVILENTNFRQLENSNSISEKIMSEPLNYVSKIQTKSEHDLNDLQNFTPNDVISQQTNVNDTLSAPNNSITMTSDYNYQNSLLQNENSNQQNIIGYETSNSINATSDMVQPQYISPETMNQNIQENINTISQDLILNQNVNTNDLNTVKYNNSTEAGNTLSNISYNNKSGELSNFSTNLPNLTVNNTPTNSPISQNDIASVPEIASQNFENNGLATSQSSSTQNNVNSTTSNDTTGVPNLDIFGI